MGMRTSALGLPQQRCEKLTWRPVSRPPSTEAAPYRRLPPREQAPLRPQNGSGLLPASLLRYIQINFTMFYACTDECRCSYRNCNRRAQMRRCGAALMSLWHCKSHASLSVCKSGWMCQVVTRDSITCAHTQDGGEKLSMQVPQVAAGHLPERKRSVTMMQVHHSNVRWPACVQGYLHYFHCV